MTTPQVWHKLPTGELKKHGQPIFEYITILDNRYISILKILSMTALPAGDVINEVMTPACHTVFNTSILTILYMIIFNLIILFKLALNR